MLPVLEYFCRNEKRLRTRAIVASNAPEDCYTGTMERNIRLYPWFEFCRNLLFWQATWFLYFQSNLTAAEAILLYAVYDLSTTVLEVPSGYLSDRIGRRITLSLAGLFSLTAMLVLATASSFALFALAQILLGAGMAFVSGTNSALLYESLEATGQGTQIEAQNVTAWRYGFSALALSAVLGGVAALWWPALPFVASALAFAVMLAITLRFTEPPHADRVASEWGRLRELGAEFRTPALRWLFALGVLMYGFSHIPFVFGQPYIADALARADLSADAPLVSGVVTALMMGVSLLTSMVAPGLRKRVGLGALLLVAFAMQVGLAAALSLTGSALAIGFLLLRMVPDSLSTPFIIAHIQPLLGDDSRATFLSLKSLLGRLVFAASLGFAALSTGTVDEMTRAELQTVLMAYALGGAVCLITLALTLRRSDLRD